MECFVMARIVTFNVHEWRDAAGRERLDDIVALLVSLDADVIALQEVPRDKRLDHVADALRSSVAWAPAAFLGNALLSRNELHDVVSTFLSAPGHELRGALAAQTVVHGEALRVVVSHLDHQHEKARVLQSQQLVAWAAGAPHLLVGDLNAVDLDDYSEARHAELDAQRRALGWEALRGDVLADLKQALYLDVVAPFLSKRAGVSTCRAGIRIDHALLSPRCPWLASAACVVATDVSDHHPVVVNLVHGSALARVK
jgi:endonuclease/exonuclease/phosphatase family metal-dependent hydrolase